MKKIINNYMYVNFKKTIEVIVIKRVLVFSILFVLTNIVNTFSQTAESIKLTEGLLINIERPAADQTISPDPIKAIVETGEWENPSENEELKFGDKVVGVWKSIKANENGWFEGDDFVNSYAYFNYNAEKDMTILFEAMGNTMAYVNGVAHSGNPYRYQDNYEDWEVRFDYSLIPIQLKKGSNSILLQCNRGLLKVKLNPTESIVLFNRKDLTIPDIIVNKDVKTFGGVPIINATNKTYSNLKVKTSFENSAPEYYEINKLYPNSIYKTPFHINIPAQSKIGKISLKIELIDNKNNVLASSIIELKVVNSNDTHRETFISAMDKSVQYYAVNPPQNLKAEKPALFLTLHGAGVEAINQAYAYGHKNWGYVVAPTNRRPYGYNWENWGRLDALEVLDIAKNKFNIDQSRVYLTGHSMGGHGSWHLGINYPDKFAAIAPSAGWISIWSYRIRPQSDSASVERMLLRSLKHSDTYAFTKNLKNNGIYIIHGDSDDNVPPQQAYSIVENLSKFHKDFVFHEEPGAGHWWDNSDEPGADCTDWMPMFDFFAHHSIASNDMVKEIEFETASLGVTSKNYWVEIINQIELQKMSKINIHLEFGNKKFVGTTENIALMSIDASMLSYGDTLSVDIDDQLIEGIVNVEGKPLYLKNIDGTWELTNGYSKKDKYPARGGNFREVLNNDVLFVIGTKGNKKENTWAYKKAIYDAERIWYQGNGSIEIIEDSEFSNEKYKDRNVILFGNSETNSAWNKLLNDSPVQIDDNSIKVGEKEFKGDDLACLMIRPRKDSETASVGVVTGTGLAGMEIANFALYYHQYVGFPDIIIYNSEILKSDEDGIKFIGYFGNDWSITKGEFIQK